MLRQRVITALIAGPIALAGVFLLPFYGFAVFMGAIVVVAAWEWANFASLSPALRWGYAALIALVLPLTLLLPAQHLLAASLAWWLIALALVLTFPASSRYWAPAPLVLLIGILVLASAWLALVNLRQFDDYPYLICLLFFLVWGADIGAYFSGKAFGKAKLAPRVSPGKSWAGFLGGLVCALAIATLMSLWHGRPDLASPQGAAFLALCVLVAMVSVLGDLSVSMFKRHRDIKDTGRLLPGHGGVLDRVDSLLSATPLFVVSLWLLEW